MTNSIALILGVSASLGLGTLALQNTNTPDTTARADCPGQITCPQTNKTVCLDQCPWEPTDKTAKP